MIYINILTSSSFNNFLHQVDGERFLDSISFFENSSKDILWDMVVVYEDIKFLQKLKVKTGGLLFISGEPPMSSVYPTEFLRQFDIVLSSHGQLKHKNNILSQQGLNWHFGYNFRDNSYKYNFEDLKNLSLPVKSRNISIISSSKKMMPGHNKRISLIEKLEYLFKDEIDFYGKDINPINDKADAILPYRFHICIENSFIDDYWTEKFSDPIIGYSVPIYIGCTNIKKYFKEDFFYNFEIDNVNEIIAVIRELLMDPEKYYNLKVGALIIARGKILHEYNTISVIERIFVKSSISLNKWSVNNLKPKASFKGYRFLISKLRIKRFLFKILFNLRK